jgi:hypothetical protein
MSQRSISTISSGTSLGVTPVEPKITAKVIHGKSVMKRNLKMKHQAVQNYDNEYDEKSHPLNSSVIKRAINYVHKNVRAV